jgi:hypothetical protein
MEKYEREVPAEVIGRLVMNELRQLDEVAYVRFASVYRRFQEATDFVQEVKRWEAKSDCVSRRLHVVRMACGKAVPLSAANISVEVEERTRRYSIRSSSGTLPMPFSTISGTN